MPTARITDLHTLECKLINVTAYEASDLRRHAIKLANFYCAHLPMSRSDAMRHAWSVIKRTCSLSYPMDFDQERKIRNW